MTTLPKLRSGFAPRGMSRSAAAAYVGISATKFDELVGDGRMPKPKCIDSRKVWDRFELDDAFAELPSEEAENPWPEMVR